jgi:hypothetical protein
MLLHHLWVVGTCALLKLPLAGVHLLILLAIEPMRPQFKVVPKVKNNLRVSLEGAAGLVAT